jgi:transglutaminase-like putative cysteine protease
MSETHHTAWSAARGALCLFVAVLLALTLARTAESASSDYFRFSYMPGGDFRIALTGSSVRLENLPDTQAFSRVLLRVTRKRDGALLFEDKLSRGKNGTAALSVKGIRDGDYFIELYTSDDTQFVSYARGSDVEFYVTGGVMKFAQSPLYEVNSKIFNSKRMDLQAQQYYTRSTTSVQSGDAAIIAKSRAIVTAAGAIRGYGEVLAICDYVSASFWYDRDAAVSGNIGPTDALSTLGREVGTCENFANITAALLRARGYPAKIVKGFTGTVSHSWNEVFVDDKWIIVDTTWNTGNYVENGVKTRSLGVYTHRYFDAALEAFSRDHTYREYSEKAIIAPSGMKAVAKPVSYGVIVDGKAVEQAMYSIGGNTRFQLRGLAMIMSGTQKQFSVNWDAKQNAIFLTTGEKYEPTGAERKSAPPGDKNASLTSASVFVDGRRVYMQAYNIDGSNYFMIRDICRILDVYLNWDNVNREMVIDTSRGYTLDS